jgi:hypothetical protein
MKSFGPGTTLCRQSIAKASSTRLSDTRSMYSRHMSRLKDICVDCTNPWALAHWWAEVLAYRVRPHSEKDIAELHQMGIYRPEDDPSVAVDPIHEPGPTFWFNRVSEKKSVKNRLHIDVYGDTELLTERGARILSRREGWTVMADPEGNEFCVFESDTALCI